MQRKTLISLLSVALLATMVLTPIVEAQPEGRRGDGQGRRGRGGGGFGGGRGGFGGGRGGGEGATATLGLIRVEEVREEVKITEDQQELIQILGDELREGRPEFPENYRDMTDEEQQEFRAKMEKWGAEQATQAKETLKAILEPEQYQRLQEISIQTQGVRALADADVIASLNVTEEQQAKLKEVGDTAREEVGNAIREMFQGGGAGGFDRDAMREKMETFRKDSEEKVLAVLTAEQKAAFEAMKGQPFEMPESAQRGGFGGGGRGGFGGDRGGRGRRGGGDRPGGSDRPQRPE